jgi:hypothetical protein
VSRPDDAVPELAPELAELDRALEGIHFEPRSSLGPELAGRARRGERPKGAVPSRRGPALLWAAAAALVVGVAGLWTTRGAPKVTVDRCCYDLDGGGVADDGVVLLARRDAEVRRLRVYEDLDGSRDFSAGDLIRLDRGPAPVMQKALDGGLITTDHCCLDFDGGGYADDGLLVIGVPPNRVVMAAIYERPRGFAGADPAAGWPLR